MFSQYFKQELGNLKEIAQIFSKEQPALAPMLGEPSSDPDVDRLLEGVAFLTGYIREKIDDEFPEIIHELLRQTWPHYLKPVPSTTLIQFYPEAGLNQIQEIASGAFVKSDPVDGTVISKFSPRTMVIGSVCRKFIGVPSPRRRVHTPNGPLLPRIKRWLPISIVKPCF